MSVDSTQKVNLDKNSAVQGKENISDFILYLKRKREKEDS